MKPEVVNFLKKGFLFVLVLVLVDNVLGLSLRRIYFNQKKGQFAQTTFSIDSTQQDLLIFGSSRATRHYSPTILTDSLGLSAYNVGRDAQMIPYYAALQEVILNRYIPKMIILDVNSWELSVGEGKYEKLSILLPYCHEHPELNPYIFQSSKWERFKLYSKTYPYNSSLFILGYNKIFENKLKADTNGYAPLEGQMTAATLEDHLRRTRLGNSEENENGTEIDEKALDYYSKFLALTKKHNIKTFVVISPKIVKEEPNYKVNLMMKVAKQYDNVKFINFSINPNYNSRFEKFADVFHLNAQGSRQFTRDLIKDLKRTL